MGLEFLARVRSSTLWLAALAALMVANYAGWRTGLGLAAGAAWSLANLGLLERLIVTITGPERRTRHLRAARRRVAGRDARALRRRRAAAEGLPPAALVAGFLVPYAVMMFKAAAALLLDSPLWARLTRSPWRSLALVLGVAALAWAVAASLPSLGGASPAHEPQARRRPRRPATARSPPRSRRRSSGPEKFANVISVLVKANPRTGWAHWLHRFEPVLFSLFVALRALADRLPGHAEEAVDPGAAPERGRERRRDALRLRGRHPGPEVRAALRAVPRHALHLHPGDEPVRAHPVHGVAHLEPQRHRGARDLHASSTCSTPASASWGRWATSTTWRAARARRSRGAWCPSCCPCT